MHFPNILENEPLVIFKSVTLLINIVYQKY
jgi:hypothetical protein